MEKKTKQKRRLTNYAVQPRYLGARAGDDKAGERMRKLFVPATKEEYQNTDQCGNLKSTIYFDVARKRVVTLKKWLGFDQMEKRGCVLLSQSMSSAMWLYRGICLFPNPIVLCEGSNGYKYPWALPLKHVETGELLVLCEWKGAFSLHSRFHGVEQAPKNFMRDVRRLLNLMLSNKCPHPYDQVVAGSVA